jgi:NitT/TauT family transport system substrate-binding protein
VLIVRTQYLLEHPDRVSALIRGEQKAVDFAAANAADAKTVTNDSIKQLTGSSLAPAVLDRSFTELQFTLDPLAATFPQLAKDSVTAGVADKETSLKGFIDVTALNGVLTQAGKPAVDAAGLDKAQG